MNPFGRIPVLVADDGGQWVAADLALVGQEIVLDELPEVGAVATFGSTACGRDLRAQGRGIAEIDADALRAPVRTRSVETVS